MTAKGKAIYIAKKFVQLIIVMILLSVIVFTIARLSPGDPLRAYYGDGVEHMSTEQKERAEENLGLDKGIPQQFVTWVKDAASGDFGISYKYKQPVTEVIGRMWQNTAILGITAFVLMFGFAILLGLFCAKNEGKRIDRAIRRIGTVSNSIPVFFMALLLILFFAVKLPIFPTGGAYSLGGGGLFDRLAHMILPVTVLILEHLWYYAYMIRNMLIEETRRDYVLLAKIKGLSRKTILVKHCLRNTMPKIVTIMALALPHMLGGMYVVEMVFSYPGLGTLSFEAAKYHDYNMLMVLCLITGLVVVILNVSAQVISEMIDPRMRYERLEEEI